MMMMGRRRRMGVGGLGEDRDRWGGNGLTTAVELNQIIMTGITDANEAGIAEVRQR